MAMALYFDTTNRKWLKTVLLVFLYCFYILLAVSKQNTQAQRAHTHTRTNAHTHAWKNTRTTSSHIQFSSAWKDTRTTSSHIQFSNLEHDSTQYSRRGVEGVEERITVAKYVLCRFKINRIMRHPMRLGALTMFIHPPHHGSHPREQETYHFMPYQRCQHLSRYPNDLQA